MIKIGTGVKPVIGFIGFGEVTYYISQGLFESGIETINVFSRALLNPEKEKKERNRGNELGVDLTCSLEEIMNNSDIVFSSARGDVAYQLAEKIAPFCKKNQLFVDLNNAVPEDKCASAILIEEKGAFYVDVGLLELPIQVGHKALMYASGKGAEKFKEIMNPYGMNIHYLGDKPGKAAAVKAIANIYMKGIQGVCLEFVISAYKAKIDFDLLLPLLIKPLENLTRMEDVPFWINRGALLASRKTLEMKEACKMLKGMGIEPVILEAAIERLKKISVFNLKEYFNGPVTPADYKKIIEKMIKLSQENGIEIS